MVTHQKQINNKRITGNLGIQIPIITVEVCFCSVQPEGVSFVTHRVFSIDIKLSIVDATTPTRKGTSNKDSLCIVVVD